MVKSNVVFLASNLLFSGVSLAQSHVNFYGVMDVGYTNVSSTSNSAKNLLRSGNLLTSRFGIKGYEDLGQGIKANFVLEGGISSDTGATSTPFFNRQSWLGIGSTRFGEIRIGRMLPITSDLFSPSIQSSYLGNTAAAIDGGAIGANSSVSRFNNMFGGTRVNNSVKYQTPSYSGFKGHVMTAFGEVEGAASAGRTFSIAGSYNAKNIEAGIAYHEKKCSSANGCDAAQDKDRIIGAGLAYKDNGARYAILYSNQKNSLNVKRNNADVISIMLIEPVGKYSLGAGLQYLNDKTQLNQDTTQINLGINFNLSKRTLVYGLFSHQIVSNDGKAGMYSITAENNKQSQISFGLTHKF